MSVATRLTAFAAAMAAVFALAFGVGRLTEPVDGPQQPVHTPHPASQHPASQHPESETAP